jgi:uncharacterized membrane protein YedE/YeeE
MGNVNLIAAIGGGALIGLGVAMLLLLNGRLAGVSGIVSGLLAVPGADTPWRALFVAGLVGGGAVFALSAPGVFDAAAPLHLPGLLTAGVLVGLGTRLANGCTSGHGLCGISRLSRRSILATVIFIALGMATVFVVRHAFRGAP